MQYDPATQGKTFNYNKESLASAWNDIHTIDQEPWPTAEVLKARLDVPGVDLQQASPAYGDDYAALSDAIQTAWVEFHNGYFEKAHEKGKQCGPVAGYITGLAMNSLATYRTPEQERADLYLQAAEQAKANNKILPGDVNAEYVYAFNMGRYSETVSIAKAISSGAGLSFKKGLEACLRLKPDHVPSLLAQGALYAQVIDAVGELAAKVSFGATRKKVFAAYDTAMTVKNPPPVVYLEYAKNILLLDTKQKTKADALLRSALEAPVYDPLDVYDQQEAKALLEKISQK